ncbi:type 1 fimbrial protein [Moellerella wisconsensis]|uniref:fimbrial protein n=1 Tax=Moellerella wisconsensis TaxID=158849 RepID=UPI001F4DC1B0|nr:fimbrial protein [Moellerella wisconsensis]UNH41779.1 type 1 fimbrial protein [Moellerella wisconsensis]
MKKIMNVFLLIICFLMSFLSFGSDRINLKFSGDIKASTCNISNGANINIDLKNIPAITFEKLNSFSAWSYFSIDLNNCSSAINQVKITFTGISAPEDVNSLYRNQGTAKNIAVQLENNTGKIQLGNKKSLNVSINGKDNVKILLRTRAFSKSGNGMPGTISAKITANIIYL